MPMVYLLLSNLLLIVFFLIYHIRLRKLTFHNWNRWYLLISILLAFGIPYILYVDFQLPEVMAINLPNLELSEFQVSKMGIIDQQQNSVKTDEYLHLIYWTGVLISMFMLVMKIFLLVKQNKPNDTKESYSFFGHINIGMHVKDNEMIRIHEEIHVKQGHSYDLLFIEIIQVFNWFNPLFYFLKQALKFMHECQVDTHFYANKVAYAELLISQTLQVDPALLRHDFSNHSILKTRIKMLFKKASAPLDRINYLWIVPISLLGLLLIKNSQADSRQYLENYPNLNLSKDVLFSKNQQEIFNYDEIDQPPVYPGGIDAFRKTVNERVIISDQAIQANIRGVVEVSFTINKKGEMQDFELVRDLGYQSGDNVITAIKQTKRWTPAIRNGNPVSVRYVLPIRFDLSL